MLHRLNQKTFILQNRAGENFAPFPKTATIGDAIMKIQYLGTAAAEAIPGLFCNCALCRHAREVGGKEIKTRSQALVDGEILIDFPMDTYLHVLHQGLDLRGIHHCLITHSHSDHFTPMEFWCRMPGIAHDIGEEPLHVYLTEAGYLQAQRELGRDFLSPRLSFHKIVPFADFTIGDYRIVPLAANHDPASDPVIYIIEKGEKSMLYANDTGIFPERTWEYLSTYGRTFDFVSLDCTAMALTGWRDSHMGLDTNRELYDRLVSMGLCDSHTTAYVNHFSHNGRLTHEELVEAAAKLGFGATYDGLTVAF